MMICLATLTRMHYMSDLGSTEVMKLAMNRLPNRLKWAEFSYSVHNREEPTLRHLERWLQDRIMEARDPHLANNKLTKPTKSISFKEKISSLMTYVDKGDETEDHCPLCDYAHRLMRCDLYLNKTVEKRNKFVKDNGFCMNCLKVGHRKDDCLSPFNCRVPGCKVLHHTTLHDDDNNDAKVKEDRSDNKMAMKNDTPVTKVGFSKTIKRQVLLNVLQVKLVACMEKSQQPI